MAVLVASLVVVAVGRVKGFNINLTKKKLFNKIHEFFFTFSSTYNTPPQNNGITLPPHVLLVAPPLHRPLCRGQACVFLVGCCVGICRLGAIYSHDVFYFFIFCHLICRPQIVGKRPPHTFCHGLSPTPTSPPPRTPTFCWLLCPPIEWWPSKDLALSLSLIFNGLPFWQPKLPPQQEKKQTELTQHHPQCGEEAHCTRTGGWWPRAEVEALVDTLPCIVPRSWLLCGCVGCVLCCGLRILPIL